MRPVIDILMVNHFMTDMFRALFDHWNYGEVSVHGWMNRPMSDDAIYLSFFVRFISPSQLNLTGIFHCSCHGKADHMGCRMQKGSIHAITMISSTANRDPRTRYTNLSFKLDFNISITNLTHNSKSHHRLYPEFPTLNPNFENGSRNPPQG